MGTMLNIRADRYPGSLGLLIALSVLSGCATSQSSGDPHAGTDLIGTVWLLEDIERHGVMDMLQSTIEFESTERALVNAGCNRAFSNITFNGSEIKFGAFGITRRACPESIMDQEHRFLQALDSARRYRIDQASELLYFFAEDGRELLHFSRMSGK